VKSPGPHPLEAGELELDRDARVACGLDQRAALRSDPVARLAVLGLDLRPDPRWIGIQPEDDLRGALRDRRCETVGEAPRDLGLDQ
jgi:hypothetical protein